MRAIVFILPWCLLSPAAAAADPAPELVVAAGGRVHLVPPEEGARVEAAFDGGALVPVGESIAAPAAGDHWLAVASRDRAGNLSPIRWIRVRVDAAPPRLELETRPAAVGGDDGRDWLPPGAEAVARAADDLAGVARLALTVTAVPRPGETREVESGEVAAPLPAAGEATVRAWAADRVGNSGGSADRTLWVDAAPPAVEIRLAGPHVPGAGGGLEGAVLAPSARLEAEITDDGSGLAGWTARRDGAEVEPEAWRGPWTPGAHTVAAVAVDRVGNEGRAGPWRFLVDGEGPEITWRVLSDGADDDGGNTGSPDRGSPQRWYRPTVEVAVEARDAPAGLAELRAAAGGAELAAVDGPIAVDGDRLLLVAVDRVGNRTEVEARWPVDREPPEVRVAGVAPGGQLTVVRGQALEVQAVDRGAGVASATYVMNRGWPLPPRARPLPERIVCRRAGRFELTIEAVDRLGNAFRGVWRVVVRRSGE